MKILLAVDGSDHSYEAVRALRYLSRAEELLVVHALDVPAPPYPEMIPEVAQELFRMQEGRMREDGTRLLDRIESLLAADVGPITKHLVTGNPAQEISALADKSQTDVIVMGTRGLGPIKERLIGSVSHRVLTFAPGAKFIVPGPLQALKHILLPLQGTHDADQAVRFLEQQPLRQPTMLSLLTVLPHLCSPRLVSSASAKLEGHALESARECLQHTANTLAGMGYQTRIRALLGTPVQAILHEAQAVSADLILLGSRGRRGVARIILGSVSHALLHQASFPLLILSSQDPAKGV